MADNSGIGWTDASWPVVVGCEHVSPGCDRCYAATLTGGRLAHLPDYTGLAEGGRFNGTVRLLPQRLDWPLRWRRPRRVFVCSMSDLFHKDVPDGFIARVWDVMARCPQHTFQILTKRHARMRSWVSRWADRRGDDDVTGSTNNLPLMPRGPEAVRAVYSSGRARLFADMLDHIGTPPKGYAYPLYDWMQGPRFWPTVLPNVHLGVSVENDHWAGIRIPALLDTPAALRWISAEPLLGSVNLDRPGWLWDGDRDEPGGIGWVVVGGETGRGYRPMDIDSLRAVVSQCRDAGTAVYVKQDSGPRPGLQGRIPDDLWSLKQYPDITDGLVV